MFGGNFNWRGPVWMPVNGLIIRALLQYYAYYGDDFTVECPTGSGREMTLYEVAEELSRRLSGTFLRNEQGRRPVYGESRTFQEDPHWRDLVLFYEYFQGDSGLGLGARGVEVPDGRKAAAEPVGGQLPPRSTRQGTVQLRAGYPRLAPVVLALSVEGAGVRAGADHFLSVDNS